LGRVAGPFLHKPFPLFQISPINVIEKKHSDNFRFLHNLSFPYNGDSINDNIGQEEKTVHYSNIGDAIKMILHHGNVPFLSKTDIVDAFRLIPIRPIDYPKLGIKFNGLFYYDKVLPQGCGSSCRIFSAFSAAIKHIHLSLSPSLSTVHLLDDFLFVSHTETQNLFAQNLFKDICSFIGIPLSAKKTTLPSTVCTFLGVELDTHNRCARLPQEKLLFYTEEIRSILHKSYITKRDMQSIIGKLSFAASIVPGRPFLRRLIDSTMGLDNLTSR